MFNMFRGFRIFFRMMNDSHFSGYWVRLGCWFPGCSWEETAPHWVVIAIAPSKKRKVWKNNVKHTCPVLLGYSTTYYRYYTLMIFPTAVFTEDLIGLRLVANRFLGKFGFLCLTHLYNICMCNTLLGPLQGKILCLFF